MTDDQVLELQDKWQDEAYRIAESVVADKLPERFRYQFPTIFGGKRETIDNGFYDGGCFGKFASFLDLMVGDVLDTSISTDTEDSDDIPTYLKNDSEEWIESAIECGCIDLPSDLDDVEQELDELFETRPDCAEYPIYIPSEDSSTMFTINSSIGWFKLMNLEWDWDLDLEFDAEEAIAKMRKFVQSDNGYLDPEWRKETYADVYERGILWLSRSMTLEA